MTHPAREPGRADARPSTGEKGPFTGRHPVARRLQLRAGAGSGLLLAGGRWPAAGRRSAYPAGARESGRGGMLLRRIRNPPGHAG